MADAPFPAPKPGPAAGRPIINVRQVIDANARRVSLWDLASEGKKSIKVINLKRINESLGLAMDQTLRKYEKQIGHVLRQKIEHEATRNFLELMDLHQKVVEAKTVDDRYRKDLESELFRLREDLQKHEGSLSAERNRAIDQHSFMLSEDGFQDLEKHLRRVLGAFMNEERRLQIAEHGPEILRGMNETEKALGEVLRRILEEERRRVFEQQERIRTQEIDVLERRIDKLKESLTLREQALDQMARLKAGDPGIASIYSSVQGLSERENNLAKKREMLRVIFEKNLELREQLAQTA